MAVVDLAHQIYAAIWHWIPMFVVISLSQNPEKTRQNKNDPKTFF